MNFSKSESDKKVLEDIVQVWWGGGAGGEGSKI